MNWKVLFGLLVATVIYIVGGTLMFMYVEGEYRYAKRQKGLTVNDMSKHLQGRCVESLCQFYTSQGSPVIVHWTSDSLS